MREYYKAGEKMFSNCWLTVNRACNLRCSWCYAKDTNYSTKDNMDIDLAKKIINICDELDIKHITVIGGEPTIYPHLFEVIQYIKDKNINCGIVTNGLAFEKEEFVDKLLNLGIKNFSISLKGENKETFKEITGFDKWDSVINGIKLLIRKKCSVSISMVLTEDNIDTFISGVKECYELGVSHFRFSFCYEFNANNETTNFSNPTKPKKLIKKFMENYPELHKACNGHFNLFQSYPLCLWDDSFIKLLIKRNQVSSICQLLNTSGLLFDSNGYLIPCNAMYDIKLGKLGVDFNDSNDLLNYLKTKDIKNVYKVLTGVPSQKCIECPKLQYCGGGCVCQWTNYKFEDLFEEED